MLHVHTHTCTTNTSIHARMHMRVHMHAHIQIHTYRLYEHGGNVGHDHGAHEVFEEGVLDGLWAVFKRVVSTQGPSG